MFSSINQLVNVKVFRTRTPSDDQLRALIILYYLPQWLFYVAERGAWMYWSGNLWKFIRPDQLFNLAAEIADRLEKELKIPKASDPDETKKFRKFKSQLINSFRNVGMARSAFTALRSFDEVRTNLDDWSPRNMLGAGNVAIVFEPKRKEIWIEDLTPLHRIYQFLGTGYDHEAHCTRWRPFVLEICENSIPKAEYLQKMVGVMLLGIESIQESYFLLGIAGSGKSTFVSTIAALFGDLSVNIPFSTLEATNGNCIPNDIAMLQGKLVAVAAESRPGARLKSETLKALSSSELISARFLYQNHFSFQNRAKLLFSMNEMPEITDTSEGVIRRLRVIELNRSFMGNPDYNLLDKLKSELPGILNWAIEGVFKFWDEGLSPTREMKLFSAGLKLRINSASAFIESNVEANMDESIKATAIYLNYRYWCQEKSISPVSQKQFGSIMYSKYPTHRVKDSVYKYKGLIYTGIDYEAEYGR